MLQIHAGGWKTVILIEVNSRRKKAVSKKSATINGKGPFVWLGWRSTQGIGDKPGTKYLRGLSRSDHYGGKFLL
jgi:hypothetical protein